MTRRGHVEHGSRTRRVVGVDDADERPRLPVAATVLGAHRGARGRGGEPAPGDRRRPAARPADRGGAAPQQRLARGPDPAAGALHGGLRAAGPLGQHDLGLRARGDGGDGAAHHRVGDAAGRVQRPGPLHRDAGRRDRHRRRRHAAAAAGEDALPARAGGPHHRRLHARHDARRDHRRRPVRPARPPPWAPGSSRSLRGRCSASSVSSPGRPSRSWSGATAPR